MAKTLKPCTCSTFTAYDLDRDVEYTTSCFAQTARDFAPGHDAKLKGNLIRWSILGYEIRQGDATKSAEGWAESFGFGYQVRNGIANHQKKVAAKVAKMEAKQRSKAISKAITETTKMLKEGVVDADRGAIAGSIVGIVEAENAAFEAKQVEERKAQQASMEWTELPGGDTPAAEVALIEMPVEVTLVEAKVGRWTYLGEVINGWFVYKTKSGEKKSTKSYTLTGK